MKKLFAIILCAAAVFLTACGNSADESKAETTTTEAAVATESHTTELYSGVTTIYERPLRMRGDYDSVPTMTFPAPLPEKERTTVKIRTSKKDPYSYVVKKYYENLVETQGLDAVERARYFLYDIDGDGSEELIFGQLDVLGGTDVYDIRVTIDEAPMVYGMMIVDVYSIIDGKPFRQDKINLSGGGAYETQILSNGIMKSCRDTPYFPLYSYYKFTDGVGDYVAALVMYRNGTFAYRGKNSREDEFISQEEFNRRIAEIEDGAHPIEIKWKRLQDYGK